MSLKLFFRLKILLTRVAVGDHTLIPRLFKSWSVYESASPLAIPWNLV